MSEHADGRRHRLEQELQALRGEGEGFQPVPFLGRRGRAWSRLHAALERARNMLKRLAVAFQLFNAPLRSEVGHGRPQ